MLFLFVLYYSAFANRFKNFQSGYLIQYIWIIVFKNEPSKICGRQPLKNLKWYGLLGRISPLSVLKLLFWKWLEILRSQSGVL